MGPLLVRSGLLWVSRVMSRVMRGIRGLVKRVSRVMRVMVEEVRWYDGLRGI